MVIVPARLRRGGDFFAPARISASVPQCLSASADQCINGSMHQRITALANQVGLEKAQSQAEALGFVFQERDGQFKIHQPCLLD